MLGTSSGITEGMKCLSELIDNIGNDLVNANTKGHKKTRLIFSDVMYRKFRQPGADMANGNQEPTGVMLGTGVKLVATEKIFTQGAPERTNNELDVCINGKGFLRVLTSDGGVGYTRDGRLRKNASGHLVTSTGLEVQPSIRIPTNAISTNISNNGEVSVMQPGSTAPTIVGRLELADFVNPGGLEPIGDNLYLETPGSGSAILGEANTSGMGHIMQRYVEGSNVNTMESLFAMMDARRLFDAVAKIAAMKDEMEKSAIQNIK